MNYFDTLFAKKYGVGGGSMFATLFGKSLGGGTPTPSTDLTGTTWQIKNSYTELDCPWRGDVYNINFTSNGNNYTRLRFINYNIDYYFPATTVFAPASGPPSWANQAYRTIAITGGADTGSTALREWLEANATQIV